MTHRERAAQGDYKLVLDSSDMSKLIAYNILAYALKDEDSKFLGAHSTRNLLDEFEKAYKFDVDKCIAKIYDNEG